ncbi:MAG: hypothetical protein Ct9H300mP32_0640 [Verrucomicrobiota bacterium]|nr:MAG: hypothetical protein Ct9H300mP32_0640 [Verrucomicrobiota bacterium]
MGFPENQNLPGFISLCPPDNVGGAKITAGFSPAFYQGTKIGEFNQKSVRFLRNLDNKKLSSKLQRKQLNFFQSLNRDCSTEKNKARRSRVSSSRTNWLSACSRPCRN